MVVYNEENIPELEELDATGTLSEKMINKYEYIKHKDAFNFLVETLANNKILYGFAKELDYKVNDELEFIVFFNEKAYDDNPRVFTLERTYYDTGMRSCEDLLHKFKLALTRLNEMEKYIIKCLYFDDPTISDETIYNNLLLSKNKFYIYKKSGINKLINLHISAASVVVFAK